ncbi:MAG: hypothetical protein L6V35_03625 [Alistipes putredinis]|nr:MAG: hypothetical protein L6V35_03625 [Alistipes putredinis]
MAMGLQFNNYRFAEPVTLRKTGGMIHPEPIDTETTNYKKSKFTSFGIWVPVLIEAAIANEFFIAAGVYGSLNMCDHTKYSSPKHKLHGIYAAPLTGGVTARIGFKKVYVMGNYNLSSLFPKKDKGPENKHAQRRVRSRILNFQPKTQQKNMRILRKTSAVYSALVFFYRCRTKYPA